MITHLIISTAVLIFNSLTSWFPTVTVLPWGIDEMWSSAMALFRGFILVFPPIGIVFNAFMIYIGFRLLLILFKMILGKRTPYHN